MGQKLYGPLRETVASCVMTLDRKCAWISRFQTPGNSEGLNGLTTVGNGLCTVPDRHALRWPQAPEREGDPDGPSGGGFTPARGIYPPEGVYPREA